MKTIIALAICLACTASVVQCGLVSDIVTTLPQIPGLPTVGDEQNFTPLDEEITCVSAFGAAIGAKATEILNLDLESWNDKCQQFSDQNTNRAVSFVRREFAKIPEMLRSVPIPIFTGPIVAAFIVAVMVIATSMLILGLILGALCQQFSFVIAPVMQLIKMVQQLKRCSPAQNLLLPEYNVCLDTDRDIPSILNDLDTNAVNIQKFYDLVGQ